MTETKWWAYVQDVVGSVQARAIADRVGIDRSNITRWKQGHRVDALFAIRFARAYGRSVVEALVMAEVITDAEAALTTVAVGEADALANATDEDLLAELSRRLNRPHDMGAESQRH